MTFYYKKAGPEDLDLLVQVRIEVLWAANGLPEDTDMSEVRDESHRYYRQAFREDSHVAYLVFDGEQVIIFPDKSAERQ